MRFRILILSLACLILAGCASFVPRAEHEKKIKKKNQKIEQLKTKRSALEKKLEAESRELERIKNRLSQKNLSLKSKNAQLERKLSEIKKAETRRDGDNVILTLPEAILFDLGKAKLRDRARSTLEKLGEVLRKHPDRFVVVEGHADTIPITNSWRFSSNWDLSAKRAANVVEHLVDRAGVQPDRIIGAGYGDQHPRVPNNSPENRQKNRRVEVVLYPPDLPRKQLDLSSQ